MAFKRAFRRRSSSPAGLFTAGSGALDTVRKNAGKAVGYALAVGVGATAAAALTRKLSERMSERNATLVTAAIMLLGAAGARKLSGKAGGFVGATPVALAGLGGLTDALLRASAGLRARFGLPGKTPGSAVAGLPSPSMFDDEMADRTSSAAAISRMT